MYVTRADICRQETDTQPESPGRKISRDSQNEAAPERQGLLTFFSSSITSACAASLSTIAFRRASCAGIIQRCHANSREPRSKQRGVEDVSWNRSPCAIGRRSTLPDNHNFPPMRICDQASHPGIARDLPRIMIQPNLRRPRGS